MFDFFRDTMLEIKGIDADKARIEREEKKAEKEKDKIILSSKLKSIIIVVSIFFLVSYVGTMPLLYTSNQIGLMIKNVIQVMLIIALWVALAKKTKKREIVAIIICVLFFVVQYLSTALFMS